MSLLSQTFAPMLVAVLLFSSTSAQGTQQLASGQAQFVTRVDSNEFVVINGSNNNAAIRLDRNNQQILSSNRIPHGTVLQILCIDNRGCKLSNPTEMDNGKVMYTLDGDYRLKLPVVNNKTLATIASSPQRGRTVGEQMSPATVGAIPGQ